MTKWVGAIIMAAALSTSAMVDAQRVVVEKTDGTAIDPLTPTPGAQATVFIFTSTDCPISNRYAPELRRIVSAFAPKGVVFRLVYPNPSDKAAAIGEHMAAFGLSGPI